MTTLRLRAPAKLNVSLEVLGKRDDGFHEIRSVVQPIALFDTLEVECSSQLSLDAPTFIGPPDENLALKAARRLRERLAPNRGAHIRLRKNIPVSAGLGGGSSDAAATLRLLTRLWRLRLTAPCLQEIAAELGSDVALFLANGAVAVAGRGERVTSIPAISRGVFVILSPAWSRSDKTAAVYRAVAPRDYTAGDRSARLVETLRQGVAPDQSQFVNSLERAAQEVFPNLGTLCQHVEEATGRRFVQAGAGPSLFHLFESESEGRQAARRLRRPGLVVAVARPLRNLCRITAVESRMEAS
jgi:4-diphosphocytidyl-2-C-methyl-D-erythritol kinase